MKKTLFALLLIAGCAKGINPAVVTDGQLVVDGIQAFEIALTASVNVPPNDLQIANDALAAAQQDLVKLKSGASTPTQYGQAINVVINSLQPIATDLHANDSVQRGIVALKNMVTVITSDIQNQTTVSAGRTDPRAAMRSYVAAHR